MPGILDKEIPNGRFRSLKHLDRHIRLCLWLPVSKMTDMVPWGYIINPSNPNEFIPDEAARIYFIQAQEYLKGHSYPEVAQWLVSVGYPITGNGLRQLLKERPYWDEMCLPEEERLAEYVKIRK